MVTLPYTTPTLQHCVTDGYLLGILESYPSTEDWIMNNFTNIMINSETFFEDFYRISMCFETPFLSQSRLQYSFIPKMGYSFSDFLKLCLNNHYYIWLECNRKYISNYLDTKDKRHTMLIYGCDSNGFIYSDFYAKNSKGYPFVKKLQMTDEELNLSLENLGLYTPYNSGETDFIRLLRFDHSYKYHFSVKALITQIKNFINGINLYSYVGNEINMNYKIIKEQEIEITLFGVNCLNCIAQGVVNPNFYSIRPVLLVYYFTILWKKRIVFLCERKYLDSFEFNNLSSKIDLLERKISGIRLFFFKNLIADTLTDEKRYRISEDLKTFNEEMIAFLCHVLNALQYEDL